MAKALYSSFICLCQSQELILDTPILLYELAHSHLLRVHPERYH
jgi:hypothetical protein